MAPNLDLKSSLTLRVVAVALICFVIAAAVALFGTYREVRQLNEHVADILVRQLQIQLSRVATINDVAARFPDLDPVTEILQSPGQCLQYIKPDGNVGRSRCIGFNRHIGKPPDWFATLCNWILAGRTDVASPISFQGRPYGTVVVTTESAAVVAAIWKAVSGLLGLTGLVIAAICILQYGAISRALRPTKDILAGLDRLARGDLSCRLPSFRLIELQRISEVFNTLAASLDRAIREKTELAAKLVDSQEQERLDLARDLHDELAQSLSAMSAVAASIKATAETQCPALVPEANSLSQLSMAVMRALRTTLRTLRPPEIDDFGLAASLSSLARDQERIANTQLKISLEIDGDLRVLPPTAASHVYRIVQEGLTNINKHAHAGQARVALGFGQDAGEHTTAQRRWLALTIEDDGGRAAENGVPAEGSGLGLIGIRERVMALGGTLDVLDLGDKGFKLHAMIPFEAPRGTPAMSLKTVRVLIVDDHAVVREGYRALLEKHEGLKVVGEACDAASAYQTYKATRPDVVIMDISMPGRGGIDAVEHIREFDANARVLMFTMHTGAAYALHAFRAGAKGYVTKSSPPDLLIRAVRDVAEGRLAICPEISEALAFDRVQEEKTRLDGLSPREFEILRMIIGAKSTDEIASALNLSRKTVANYHYAIKSKLGVDSDIELLYFGLRQGLVEPVSPAVDSGK